MPTKKEEIKSQEITIQKEVSPIINKIEELEIVSSENMSKATTMLSQLNKFSDNLTIEKEKLTKPINTALKEIRSRYKPVELMLEEGIVCLKKKMGQYQTVMLKAQQEAEAKIAKRVENGTLKVETAIKKIGEIDAPEAKVATDDGSVSFRAVRKFEVVDISLIPIEYHLADEVAIRKAMLANIELPGVRYYEEQQITNRRN